LYLSDISGKKFTKISANFQELLIGMVSSIKTVCTLEQLGIPKNGQFDKNDGAL
jgi:hypothetical protein